MSETSVQQIHDTQIQMYWSIALLVLAIVFTVLRFISQWRSSGDGLRVFHWFGWDDVFVLLGLISNIVVATTWIVLSKANIAVISSPNDHARLISETIVGAKAGYIGAVFYSLATAFPKLSICALYLRIFVQRRLCIVTWMVAVFLVANCIAFTIASILICVPPSYYWSSYALTGEDPSNKCINTTALSLAYNPPHIATDIVMLVLPIRTLWKLNISLAKRVGLVLTFSTGSIGLAGSVARWAVYLKGLNDSGYKLGTVATILSLVEPTMYLIAACLPPMRSLLRCGTSVFKPTPPQSPNMTWATLKLSTLQENYSARSLRKHDTSDEIPFNHRYIRHKYSEESAKLPLELMETYHNYHV
ncbi:hypothetical protein EV356DRAFT_581024 [Viridothelium virens]|uniref:Rhodopsin domain-containing protein n=1 Tax=Viridothelium virens TaxID=1048519 RepID=A0A6A6GV51_VIRVR|nr:hypothetical protein EV356DRAFT_581024 [Viridothelium virens]